MKAGDYENAIPYFESSYRFFSKKPWIDKLRWVTTFSTSAMSYREMALNNIAFCYGQVGNGLKAGEYYNKTLEEFPKSVLAQSGLNMLNSVKEEE